jgi:aryl-alcohol dehydrogenase-like predicted oxidoreductase
MQSRLNFIPSAITLGSAQFGLPYGVVNNVGQPSEAEVYEILDRAIDGGINTIDTARSYGSSEQRIGNWLALRRPQSIHIITKVPALPQGDAAERKRAINEHLDASRKALGLEMLPLVLVHDETDLIDPAVVDAFQTAVAAGTIGGFGVSAYCTDIAKRLIATIPIAALQVPVNIADQRFVQSGIIAAAAERGIAVFARSVFLQGALRGDPELLPTHLEPLAAAVRQVHRIAHDAGRPVSELLIPSVRDIPGIVSLIIGVDRAAQLDPHLSAIRAKPMSPTSIDQIEDVIRGLPRDIIDPSNWKALVGQTRGPAQT